MDVKKQKKNGVQILYNKKTKNRVKNWCKKINWSW